MILVTGASGTNGPLVKLLSQGRAVVKHFDRLNSKGLRIAAAISLLSSSATDTSLTPSF